MPPFWKEIPLKEKNKITKRNLLIDSFDVLFLSVVESLVVFTINAYDKTSILWDLWLSSLSSFAEFFAGDATLLLDIVLLFKPRVLSVSEALWVGCAFLESDATEDELRYLDFTLVTIQYCKDNPNWIDNVIKSESVLARVYTTIAEVSSTSNTGYVIAMYVVNDIARTEPTPAFKINPTWEIFFFSMMLWGTNRKKCVSYPEFSEPVRSLSIVLR